MGTDPSWLVPLLAPFLIGLVVGAMVKAAAKFVLLLLVLVAILAVTGLIAFSVEDLFGRAMDYLPNLLKTGSAAKDVLPYTSLSFLLGLLLGLWKL
ncbi:MAG: hypothetical protein QXM46_01065 [Candidatus Hadarchaeales archaeon]